MLAQRIVPILLLGCLALAILAAWTKGKDDITISGVVVEENGSFEFYPKANDCFPSGTAYLVITNEDFENYFHHRIDDLSRLDQLFRGTWRAKLRGNLSHVGRFGRQGRDAREFSVVSVVDSMELECDTVSGPSNH